MSVVLQILTTTSRGPGSMGWDREVRTSPGLGVMTAPASERARMHQCMPDKPSRTLERGKRLTTLAHILAIRAADLDLSSRVLSRVGAAHG